MRYVSMAVSITAVMIASTALAQISMPGFANAASPRIIATDAGNAMSAISATLPPSNPGLDETPQDCLRAARAFLVAGRTRASQDALEMAETRILDRSVPLGGTDVPSNDKLVSQIREAMQALGEGDRQHAIRIIDLALAS